MLRLSLHPRVAPLTCCLGVAALLTSSPVAVHGQGAELQLFLMASDATGAPVIDLEPDEVVVTEAGAPATIASLERHDVPVKVTLVIDNGPSSTALLPHYQTALTSFVEGIPEGVEVTLVTSAPQPRIVLRPTTDKAAMLKSVGAFAPDQGLPRFFDSMVEYADRLKKENEKAANYTPVLVMVSTNMAEQSRANQNRVVGALKSIGDRRTKLHIFRIDARSVDARSKGFDAEGVLRQAEVVKQTADMVQGRYVEVPTPVGITTLLPEVAREIAGIHAKQTTQYRLAVQRPGGRTGPVQDFNISVKRQGLQLALSPDGRVP